MLPVAPDKILKKGVEEKLMLVMKKINNKWHILLLPSQCLLPWASRKATWLLTCFWGS